MTYPKEVRARLFADYRDVKVCELLTNVDWKIEYLADCDLYVAI
jgi:hypothetical protein